MSLLPRLLITGQSGMGGGSKMNISSFVGSVLASIIGGIIAELVLRWLGF
jgi:hypothetical protein